MIHLAISQTIIARESQAIIASKNYNRLTVAPATPANYCSRYCSRFVSGNPRWRSHLHYCLLQAIMQMNRRFSSATANQPALHRTCCVQAQGMLFSIEYNEIGRTRDSRDTKIAWKVAQFSSSVAKQYPTLYKHHNSFIKLTSTCIIDKLVS